MDYQQSRAYIDEAQKYGSVLGLDTMRELMRRLGDPQDKLKYVHVAGTNGKGSVIAYLYSMLSEGGVRVGRYVSPALFSYRERMEANGERITREEFALCMTQIAEAAEAMTADGFSHPTPFELETAAAFLFFRMRKCSLVLLEVGMGGDMDATNIVNSTVLAVLVSISMDHTAFLGSTLTEIAGKKAGIIKKGCLAVTAPQKDEVLAVFEEKCREKGVSLTVSDNSSARIVREDYTGQTFVYKGEEYQIPLAGVCQIENAVLALNAMDLLENQGFAVAQAQRKEGLAKTIWRGRFTVLHKEPLIIEDGAHNPGAAEMLEASVQRYFADKRLIFIMGMFADKDYRTVIKRMAPYADQIFTIQTPDNPRALPAAELAEAVREFNEHVLAVSSVGEAVQKAAEAAGPQDVILAFGSLSFLGLLEEEARKLM